MGFFIRELSSYKVEWFNVIYKVNCNKTNVVIGIFSQWGASFRHMKNTEK